jgi:hypothetical protein
MPQIPESIRPYMDPILKYHFWILAALVPLLLIPAVFAASGALDKTIGSKRSEIDGHLSALRQISGEAEHPNEKWVTKVEERTTSVRQDLLTEWKAFWESQAPLRVWPDDPLGEDFVDAITTVVSAPSGKQPPLKRAMLERYQDRVRMLVRQLPPRMGCTEMMEGDAAGAGGRMGRPGMERPARPPRGREGFGGGDGLEPREPLVWDAADQQRVFQSFDWVERPTTTQVLLAQEEVWVYGLLCDAVRSLNAGETEPAKIAISEVQELAVGYPAAEDQPGGTGTGRVLTKTAGGMGLGMDMGMGGEAGMEMQGDPGMMGMEGGLGPQGRPPHPRFMDTGGGREGRRGPSMGPMGVEGEGMDAGPPMSPDEALQQWVYVDFSGKPLLASELATVPDAQMLHLMPFTLRVVMDQRKLDQLLAQLAADDIPIDVRQVRLNPVEGRHGASEGGGRGGRGGRGGGPRPTSGGRERMTEGGLGQAGGLRDYDMTVELRGTVALARPPRADVVAGTPDATGGGF